MDLLETIQERKQFFELSENDLTLIDAYAFTLNEVANRLESLMKTISDKIERAGFQAIPTPAVYLANSPTSKTINFLQALTGWSPKAKCEYYLTKEVTSVGDRLGETLMEAFAAFYQHQVKTGTLIYATDSDSKN